MNTNKKILLLSSSDTGGAGEAMVRFQEILDNLGYSTIMIVRLKTKNHHKIIPYSPKINLIKRIIIKLKNQLEKLSPLKLDKDYYFFDINETKKNINIEYLLNIIGFKPDFVFSGYIANFLNSTDLLNIHKATNAQMYNISVDMNHFTGGCHYAWDCNGYINDCDNNCPAIISKQHKNLAKKNFEKKLSNAKKGNFKIITQSGLTLNQAQKSKIYRNQEQHYNINSIIDTRVFNPKNRNLAKNIFGVNPSKITILCGAQDANEKRKGFEYLIESLKILEEKLDKNIIDAIDIIVVSNYKNESFINLKFNTKYIDFIKDYRLLSLLYQSVDLFINCSIEDSGPMMVSEALACGTPVVGFNTGVITNMIINDYNGYKAENKNSIDLANAIHKFLNLSKKERSILSINGTKQVEELSSYKTVEKIINTIIK